MNRLHALGVMHIDNLLFLLLGGVFLVLRLLSQRAEKSKQQPRDDGPRQTSRPDAQTEEERIRRFMEALGQPTSSKPPPKVTPRPIPTTPRAAAEAAAKPAEKRRPAPAWSNPLPPLTTVPPPAPAPVAAPAKRKFVPHISREPAAPFPAYEISQSPRRSTGDPNVAIPAAQRTATTADNLVSFIGSPTRWRDAIILREVLGPPRGLQPFESL